MIIKRLSYITIEPWKDTITELLNLSVKLNFPYMPENEGYGQKKYDELHEYLRAEKAIVFGAIENGELAGWIWCHEIYRMGSRRLHISEISVREEYRMRGIGKRLLAEAETYAKSNGFLELDLLVTESNEDAVRFYKDLDFDTERYLMVKKVF